MKKIKENKLLVSLLAATLLGLGGTGYFAVHSQEVEAQMDRVEVRATKETSELKKEIKSMKDDNSKEVSDLSNKFNAKNKEVETLKKKLEQSKIAEQEEINAREIAAQQAGQVQVAAVEVQQEQPVEQPQSSAPVQSQQASYSSGSSSSAKEWIAQKESSGSYTASNGQYYGRYQLNPSLYVGYDTTPAGQEAAADAYVAERYGTWENAQAFWMNNGYY